MKSTTFLCLSGLASSAVAFSPPTIRQPRLSSTWTGQTPPACSGALSQGTSATWRRLDATATTDMDPMEAMESSIPDTPMTRKFGHLRGVEVPTVDQTVKSFYDKYKRVILPQFRTIVTEFLMSTHLIVYDARFKYDALFGAGFYSSFMRFMRSYPAPGQKELIFAAMSDALGLDSKQMEIDAKRVEEWGEGKTEEDVIKALKGEGESDFVSDAFVIARTGLGPFGEGWETKGEDVEWFLYTRPWVIGVFTIMQKIGLEPNEDVVEKWFEVLGTSPQGALKDLALYTDQLAKVEQAEQLFKEIEIREKKRMAERLEEKAAWAIKEAERAEREAQEEKEEEERIANAKEGDVLPNKLPVDE